MANATPGSICDHEGAQPAQFVEAVPGDREHVGPDNQKQLRLRESRMEFANCAKRIGHAAHSQLKIRGVKRGMILNRQADQGKACLAIEQAVGGFVRRGRGGDEPDGIKSALLTSRLGQQQVAHMNRVERPAQNAEPHQWLSGEVTKWQSPSLSHVATWPLCYSHCRTWPSPKTMYLYVVSSSKPMGPRACSLSVLIPISAPSPNWNPSVNRVDALT